MAGHESDRPHEETPLLRPSQPPVESLNINAGQIDTPVVSYSAIRQNSEEPDLNSRDESQSNGYKMTWREISLPTYILVMLFAVSSWIDINGLWVEVPLLVNDLPEGWNLPSYLVVIIQIGNIGTLLYTVGHTLAPTKITEVPVIYIIISIGTISFALLVKFWDITTVIDESEHSTALLVLTGFVSLVDCTSSVVYLPYMQRLKPQYMSALYIGEGLSSLLPGFFGLAQGVGADPTCVNSSHTNYNASTGVNTTDWSVYPVYPPPRFSVEIFFIFLCAMLCISGIAFTLVHYLPYCRRVAHVENANNSNATIVTTVGGPEYTSVNQHDRDPKLQLSHDDDLYAPQPHNAKQEIDVISDGSSTSVAKFSRKHFWFLMMITAWVNALTNSVLPSTQTFTCLPYGPLAYTLAVRLSTIVNPLASALVIFLPVISLCGLSVITAVASAVSGYLLYLAALSPSPPLQDETLGVTLVILSTVLTTALFSFAKVSIAVILRDKGGHRALLWCGAVTQVGSLVGAIATYLIVNVFQLLTAMDPCAS